MITKPSERTGYTSTPSADPLAATMPEAWEAICRYLSGGEIDYELTEEGPPDLVWTSWFPPERTADAMILRNGVEYVLAFIPASERLDMGKLRIALGSATGVRRATEHEVATLFGSLRPEGRLSSARPLPLRCVVDARLLSFARIRCVLPKHRGSLMFDPEDLVHLTEAEVADICDQRPWTGRFRRSATVARRRTTSGVS